MLSFNSHNHINLINESETSFIVYHDLTSFHNHIEKMLNKMDLICFGYNPSLDQYWGKKKLSDQTLNFCIKLSNSFENNIHVTLITNYKNNYHKEITSIEANIIKYIKNI